MAILAIYSKELKYETTVKVGDTVTLYWQGNSIGGCRVLALKDAEGTPIPESLTRTGMTNQAFLEKKRVVKTNGWQSPIWLLTKTTNDFAPKPHDMTVLHKDERLSLKGVYSEHALA